MPKIERTVWQCFLGIDPGIKGGIAAIFVEPSGRQHTECHQMPATKRDIWELIQNFSPLNDIDIDGAVITANSADYLVMAHLEYVASRPGQSAPATFKFGQGYGWLEMALTAAEIRFDTVTPNKWTRALGVPVRSDTMTVSQWKNVLKGKAQQFFPGLGGITLATADALLIAEYTRQKYQLPK